MSECLTSIFIGRYPYRRYDVVTDDGYILSVDRIARPFTTRSMLLVHGIMDSSHAWVAGGAASGLGFRFISRSAL
jgi:lysosomal acid lipase/cholesteryl ester hydrolase